MYTAEHIACRQIAANGILPIRRSSSILPGPICPAPPNVSLIHSSAFGFFVMAGE
jgi:hypothetical protein